MKEIEVKILEIDRQAVEEKLRSMGAERVFDGNIDALYFSFPEGVMQNGEERLRLRREGNRAVLTFKSFIDNATVKVSEESEVEVSDFEEMKKILEAVGMSVWKRMNKHRTSYELGQARIEIDKYTDDHGHIPEFLEIEGPDAQTIFALAGRLGYSKDDCKPWKAKDLVEYYSTR